MPLSEVDKGYLWDMHAACEEIQWAKIVGLRDILKSIIEIE